MTAAGDAVIASAPRRRVHNRVLAVLVLIALAAALGTAFVSLAPNRLMSGTGVSVWEAAGRPLSAALAACGAALLAASLAPPRRGLDFGTALVAGIALLLALGAAGRSAVRLLAGAPPAAAVSLAGGFWLVVACAGLALVDALRRAKAGAAAQLFAAAILAGGFVALAAGGTFDALALAREYAARREAFGAAVLRHVELVLGAIVPALVVGVPLGLTALRRKRFEAPLFAVLNLLQTVPSIALFGLLIVPLSALAAGLPALRRIGVGGVGPAPAIIALVLYALLPVARNTVAGIGGVPAAAVDAARGMGMTAHQVFWRVEVPLALPVLLAGLRIVTVQAIGLAVVAALIGAGGLGTFVFEGLGQYATNLVLLGALPAILMALAADFLLRLAGDAVGRRFAP
jgi:osmoprotectant transport system permease protein